VADKKQTTQKQKAFVETEKKTNEKLN